MTSAVYTAAHDEGLAKRLPSAGPTWAVAGLGLGTRAAPAVSHLPRGPEPPRTTSARPGVHLGAVASPMVVKAWKLQNTLARHVGSIWTIF